jgi:hypothetical protein
MRLERFLLAIFVMSLGGISAELLVSGHTESAWQWTPLILIGLALPTLALQWRGTASLPLRILLWCFIVSGVVGTVLHTSAKMEFQSESDQSLKGWALFLKSFESKNPPALAPGAMVQLGLVGLAYQAARSAGRSKRKEETA